MSSIEVPLRPTELAFKLSVIVSILFNEKSALDLLPLLPCLTSLYHLSLSTYSRLIVSLNYVIRSS